VGIVSRLKSASIALFWFIEQEKDVRLCTVLPLWVIQ
jgi:hypothetical protein